MKLTGNTILSTMNKTLVLIFSFIVLSSLMMLTVKPADAQTVTTPSVPQFTVKIIDNSHDVPPTQTTDQYTGVTTTQPGYHVDNRTIEVSIKNQPFTPYTNASGNKISLFYWIEFKGHFGDDTDWRIFGYNWPLVPSESEYRIS